MDIVSLLEPADLGSVLNIILNNHDADLEDAVRRSAISWGPTTANQETNSEKIRFFQLSGVITFETVLTTFSYSYYKS